MYSEKKNVLQLLALLKAYDIDKIVLSPGNRNVPIVHSIEMDPYFTCFSVVDERSAAFFALGLIMKTQKPVAICCTSGTSLLNYGSAIAEAFYQKLPLVVISADKSQKYKGQNEGQLILQSGIYNHIVKKSVDIDEVSTDEEEWYCNRLINEALMELDHNGKGPVHINITIWNKLYNFTVPNLPDARKITRLTLTSLKTEMKHYGDILKKSKKRMIVFGQSLPIKEEEVVILNKFLEKFNCIIFAESLSNLHHENVIGNFERLLIAKTDLQKKELKPDLVISMNGFFINEFAIKEFNRKYPSNEHWHIAEDGAVVDQFKCLSTILEGNIYSILELLTQSIGETEELNDKSFISKWKDYDKEMTDKDYKYKYSDMYVVQQFIKEIPQHSSLHIANSSSVRLSQFFSIDESIQIFCNRGTNGIDGSFSSAVGYAAINEKLTFLLIGDLSFFYDVNAIWNKHVSKNLRVIINNNGGASIFHYTVTPELRATLNLHTAAQHGTSARGWVESLGFYYLSASNPEELAKNLPDFVNENHDRPVVLEVFTDLNTDAQAFKDQFEQRSVFTKIQDKISKKIF